MILNVHQMINFINRITKIPLKMTKSVNIWLLVLLISLISMTQIQAQNIYDNTIRLNSDYQLSWTVKDPDIIFEVQAKTTGYVGFGFSRDGTIYGADLVIGWFDQKHAFFKDCHIKTYSSGEPTVDSSQDYVFLSGNENGTHTTLKFRRKLNTCDEKYDVPITNDTMNIIFLYHMEKPKRGQISEGSLPDPMMAIHPVRPLLLLQRNQPKESKIASSSSSSSDQQISTFDIKTKIVNLKDSQNHLTRWCHIQSIDRLRNNTIIRYEPIFSSVESERSISFMRIYECRSDVDGETDFECTKSTRKLRRCFSVVATWNRGSIGLTFPSDVGFSIESDVVNYMLEIHYEPITKGTLIDNSGFRIHHTPIKRKFDAGTLTVGIEPSFLHLIPPNQKRVVSLGHCTSGCTRKSLSINGINIFGVSMSTHSLGRNIKIAVVRDGEELAPIAQDLNVNSEYLENRLLTKVTKLYPGDHITVECTYNTYERKSLTLGGESIDEEICMATLMYYPRQDQLVSCTSQAKISIVLGALGIQELSNSRPSTILAPSKYFGRTLEEHLKLYDWKNEFSRFETVMKSTPYDVLCNSASVPSRIEGMPANITKTYRPPESSCPSRDLKLNSIYEHTSNNPSDEIDNSVDGVSVKVMRSSESVSLELSSGSSVSAGHMLVTSIAILPIFIRLRLLN